MVFNFDSKYKDEDTSIVPSTVQFFPDISEFEDSLESSSSQIEPVATEWALQRIGTLQARLEYLQSSKDARRIIGKQSNFTAFPASVILETANQVFGYDGWSSEIVECLLLQDRVDGEGEEKRFSVRYSSIVRVTLNDNTVREGHGLGEATNMPHKHLCYSKAKKQAVTEGMKNAILGLREILMDFELRNLQQELDVKYNLLRS
ncbi:Rad52/22 family double-strand break repair protein-domain-containing protein [Scheffersomyces xylosifermentans]|uniref:Rad52/22 family double-strand break repair protein-domain-containing protein n=1 Tax=Scheffersomyces xylosifermentans TaxID=1304137 RepID=UPI00315D0BCD